MDPSTDPIADDTRAGAPGATPAESDPSAASSLPVRGIFAAIGTVSLVLGVVGIVVPVLPTTPFVLLAAACYARASPRLYGWLLGQPTLGPIITDWRRSRSLAPGVKRRAIALVAITFAASIALVGDPLVRATLLAIGVVLVLFLVRIPTTR